MEDSKDAISTRNVPVAALRNTLLNLTVSGKIFPTFFTFSNALHSHKVV